MAIAIAVSVVVLLVLAIWAATRTLRTPQAAPPSADAVRASAGRATVTLDVDVADPAGPAVERLVSETAARTFASHPDVDEVEVRSKGGVLLGRRERRAPPAAMVDLPPEGLEARAPRHAPGFETDLLRGSLDRVQGALPRFEGSQPDRHVPLADRFELPAPVSALIADRDDPVQLVRAIMEAAGIRTEVDDDVIRAGDDAVIVLRAPVGEAVSADALNHAYHRFRDGRARRGIVLTPGLLYPDDIRRRELMAPELLHAGPEGIQRMADAVAVGANPMLFVSAPPVAPA